MKLFHLVLSLFFFSYLEAVPYKVAVIWTGLGEFELAQRIEKSCHNLGWQCLVVYGGDPANDFHKTFADLENPQDPSSLIEHFQPDFCLHLKENMKIYPYAPNYLAVTGCSIEFFDGHFAVNEELFKYDGFLYSSPRVNSLKSFFESSGRKFNGLLWYVSCPKTDYQPIGHQTLFYCGFQWDPKRTSPAFLTLYTLLSGKGYFEVWGPESSWSYLPRSYRGFIPFGGDFLQNAIREAGITLVLHSQPHIYLAAPSSRIFEAAAACSVAISDRHPFIMEHFGDSVLYVDDYLRGEEMFSQVDAHMRWIFANPKEAEDLAKRAHNLFVTKFSLEKQLENLGKMHEKCLEDRFKKIVIGGVCKNVESCLKKTIENIEVFSESFLRL